MNMLNLRRLWIALLIILMVMGVISILTQLYAQYLPARVFLLFE